MEQVVIIVNHVSADDRLPLTEDCCVGDILCASTYVHTRTRARRP